MTHPRRFFGLTRANTDGGAPTTPTRGVGSTTRSVSSRFGRKLSYRTSFWLTCGCALRWFIMMHRQSTTPNGPTIEAQDLLSAGSAAHHRFPVWWTGDGVSLMADVGAMVTEAVHDFRSFVHSDCGGHGKCARAKVPGAPPPPPPENTPCVDVDGNPTPSNTALLRWTAHCVLGTVVRFHQGDHRFWLRDNQTQETARSYLNLRYKLAPSLIGWGNTVQKAGFPLTARCDLVWPEHPEANDPTQYLHMNATLVAPLEAELQNTNKTRSVWVTTDDSLLTTSFSLTPEH